MPVGLLILPAMVLVVLSLQGRVALSPDTLSIRTGVYNWILPLGLESWVRAAGFIVFVYLGGVGLGNRAPRVPWILAVVFLTAWLCLATMRGSTPSWGDSIFIAGSALVLTWAFTRIPWRGSEFFALMERLPRGGHPLFWYVLSGLLALATALLAWRFAYQGQIFVTDSTTQVMQARLMLTGRLVFDLPPQLREVLHLLYFSDRVPSFSLYPPVHATFLALPIAVGLPPVLWSVLSGVLLVLSTGRLAERMFSPLAGRVAMLVLAISPFYFLMHGEAMSHTTTALFLVLAALCFLRLLTCESPPSFLMLFCGGIAMGIAFGCRPLTAVSHGVIWAMVFLVHGIQQRTMDSVLAPIVSSLGFFSVYFILAWYHHNIFGDPFASSYREHELGRIVRFGFFSNDDGAYSPADGFQNLVASALWLWLQGTAWPIGGFALLVPWILRTRLHRKEAVLLLLALSQIGFHFFYHYHDLFMGPRFWYESLPFILILAARGLAPALRSPRLHGGLLTIQIFAYSFCGVFNGLHAQKIRVAQMTAPHVRFSGFIASHLPVQQPLAIVLDSEASELFGAYYPRLDPAEAPLYFVKAEKMEEAMELEELKGFEFVFYGRE